MQPRKSPSLSRRQFLGAAASAAAAFTIIPRHVLGGPGFVPPSARIHIALIGAGGQGRTNARALFNEPDARIVAVCDVAERTDLHAFYYRGFAGRLPVKAEVEKKYAAQSPGFHCAVYEDYRVLLEKEQGIDAVLCATPDHHHARVAIAAMQLGKHVYCEKPLTHNVWEARQVARAARAAGVATQLGNHGHSGEGIRETCEWIWDGAIGAVREVHAWSDGGRTFPWTGRPKETPPVPPGLNWDLWLGPRALRPYHPSYTPFTWRNYWAFGGGALEDMGCHNMDPAVWALKLEYPESVEAVSEGGVDTEVASYRNRCTYRFAARGDRPPVTMTWYDGGLRPPYPAGLDPHDPKQQIGDGGNGIVFVGEKGWITCGGWAGMPRLLPLSLHRSYRRPAKTLRRTPGHHADWLAACKGGPAASANFEYGARLTELVLLGSVALRAQQKLAWDGPAMKAVGLPAADALLKEQYRPGWELP